VCLLSNKTKATWAKKADEIFRASGILFVDCPVSGGPARAREGDLTLIASGEAACIEFAEPVLDALAEEVHVIEGGAGNGSTVKCVHQLLAGVHICAAAEAMGT
jgi:putative dehydrogenase